MQEGPQSLCPGPQPPAPSKQQLAYLQGGLMDTVPAGLASSAQEPLVERAL